MLSRLIRRSDPRKIEHHLLALSDEGPPWDSTRGAAATSLNLELEKPLTGLVRLAQVRRFVRSCAPNVIQGWMYHGNFFAGIAQRLHARSAALALGIHQCLIDIRKERPITRLMVRSGAKLSRRADRVVYASFASRDQHVDFGYCSDNTTVIPNGFDTDEFRPDSARRAATRGRLGIGESEFVVGIVARHHAIKDYPTFIKAASRFSRDSPGARFLIVGPGCTSANGELRQELERFGRGTAFDLLGSVNEVQSLYPALDVFCLTSLSEAFPNVVGEAMACGIPCITTDVGDVSRILDGNGFLVPVGDEERIANHLAKIRDMSLIERVEFGERARRAIQERFDIDTIGRRYSEMYVELSNWSVNSRMPAEARK